MHDSDSRQQITALLLRIHAGDAEAEALIAKLIYAELRGIADHLMRAERADHTLEPTALVNEAFLRLIEKDVLMKVNSRRYLFGVMSRAMRQVLVDHAKAKKAQKRGGGRRAEALDLVLASYEERNIDYLILDEALVHLEEMSQRQYDIVTRRIFGGCTTAEVAEQLGVSKATIENDYRAARAFLRRYLDDHDASYT